MKPGDLVVCQSCGGRAVATFSGPAFQEGYPVSLRWTHRGTPRIEVTAHEPELCIYCHERKGSVGEPWPRLTEAELDLAAAAANAADLREAVRRLAEPNPILVDKPYTPPAPRAGQLTLF